MASKTNNKSHHLAIMPFAILANHSEIPVNALSTADKHKLVKKASYMPNWWHLPCGKGSAAKG